jgi:hypothetical protein
MRTTFALLALVLTLTALAVLPAWTAPKPSVIQVSWQLEGELQTPGRPQPIEVYLPGETRPRVFWYVLYKVTNRSGEDEIFVPEFLLYTDTGQVLRADADVPTSVFNAIKMRHNEPLLRNRTGMTGTIRQGADNAMLGAAIWPDFDPRATRFDVFVGGLSGETAEVDLPNPVTVTEISMDGKTKQVTRNTATLTKTLRLSYAIAGDPADRVRAAIKEARPATWVMR